MPAESPSVSIIMPAYNCGGFIADSIRSVQAQTVRDWELIVICDCATDNTWEVMQSLAAEDSRIRALANERNLGVGPTRNRGVQEARAGWIAFLDSDDLWAPDKLEKQMELARKHPEGSLFFTGSSFINEKGEPIDYILQVPAVISRKELLKQNLISCSSVMVTRERLLAHPMPGRKDMHEDYAVWLSILADGSSAYAVTEPLLIYRKYSGSKSGNKRKAAVMNWHTLRSVGLSPVRAFYYEACYALRGIRKYSGLKSGEKQG